MRKSIMLLLAVAMVMLFTVPVLAVSKTCEVKYYYTSTDNPIGTPSAHTFTTTMDYWNITPANVFPNEITKQKGNLVKVYTFDGWYATDACSGTKFVPGQNTTSLKPKYINGKYLLGLYGKWRVETKKAQPQTITTEASVYQKKYSDKQFNLNAKAVNSLSYGSDNVNVCIVDNSGKVIIRGVGSANIKITAKPGKTYAEATKTVRVEISKGVQTITTTSAVYNAQAGKSFSLGAKTSGNGKLTYVSGNTSVATVAANGTVNPLKAGTVTLTINASETNNYLPASKTVTVNITPKPTTTPSSGSSSSSSGSSGSGSSGSSGSSSGSSSGGGNHSSKCSHKSTYVSNTATCTKAGIKKRICKNCGKVLKTKKSKKLGHNYNIVVSNTATCTKAGKITKKCSRCGGVAFATSKKLGHNWQKNGGAKQPTCTKEGSQGYKCSRCGKTKSKKIKALGHDWQSTGKTGPTCTKSGKQHWNCRRCGKKKDTTIKKLGHNYKFHSYKKKPTCTSNGKAVYECTRCNHSERRTVSATGHNWKKVSNGYRCTKCGKTRKTLK